MKNAGVITRMLTPRNTCGLLKVIFVVSKHLLFSSVFSHLRSCLPQFFWLLLIFVYFIRNQRISAGIYMLKVNNGDTRTRCEICSKLTIKTPEQRQHFLQTCAHQGVRNVAVGLVSLQLAYSEHISHLVLVFLLLTQSR